MPPPVQKDCMKIGYARVSTEGQNLDLQIEALTEAGCDRIITDKTQSGATAVVKVLPRLWSFWAKVIF